MQTLLRDGRSDWLMKKKKKFLVLFCFFLNIRRQLFIWDGMSTGLVGWIFLSFTPNNAMVEVLEAVMSSIIAININDKNHDLF